MCSGSTARGNNTTFGSGNSGTAAKGFRSSSAISGDCRPAHAGKRLRCRSCDACVASRDPRGLREATQASQLQVQSLPSPGKHKTATREPAGGSRVGHGSVQNLDPVRSTAKLALGAEPIVELGAAVRTTGDLERSL